MIKLMEQEPIPIQMERSMLDNGKMISRMVLELRNGQMDKDMKENIEMEQKLEKEY